MDENRGRGARDLQEIDDFSSPAEREQSIPPDEVLSAVANEQRRAIIDSLNSASENTLDYDTLVDRVADTVRDEERVGISDEQRQRVRIALRHTHLPKLEEIQVIDYDAETGHVQFVGDEMVQEVLMLVKSYDTDE